MGWLRKVGRKIGKGIRSLGREIRRGFKNVFNKLGPVGTFAMWFILPSIAHSWTAFLDKGILIPGQTQASFMAQAADKLARAAKWATKGVSTVHNGITGAMRGTLDLITKPFSKTGDGLGTRLTNFLNNKRQDFKIEPNQSWKKKLTKRIAEETNKDEIDRLTKILENVSAEPLKPEKSLGQLAKEGLVTGGINLGIDLLKYDALEEDDTGGRGIVYSNVSEQGTVPIRDLTLETAWRNAGYMGDMTANAMTNSNWIGVDAVFNHWSRGINS